MGVARPVEVTLPPHGVAVIESHHARRFEPSPMCHAFAKFVFVLDGTGTLIADRRFALGAGVLTHVPAGVRHVIEDRESPLALYAACYAPAAFESRMVERLSGSGIRHWVLADQSPHLLAGVRADLRQLLHEQRTHAIGWEVQQRAIISQMIVRAVRLDDRSDASAHDLPHGPSTERVRAYLETAGDRILLTRIDTAADACGLSRRRFTDLFRAVTGQTFQTFVHSRRIDRAKELLADTDLPVAAVAFEAGFDDLSHFHRSFRTTTGQTPGEYRAGVHARPETS